MISIQAESHVFEKALVAFFLKNEGSLEDFYRTFPLPLNAKERSRFTNAVAKLRKKRMIEPLGYTVTGMKRFKKYKICTTVLERGLLTNSKGGIICNW